MRRIISALALAAAVAATVTAGPAASAEAAPAPAEAAHASARTPVVFVHGYLSDGVTWDPAIAAFLGAGYRPGELFTYSYDFFASNKASAQGLAAFVAKVKAGTGADKVDIVNHSMGGLVSLWYAKELGGAADIKHMASLAAPHHGTYIAGLCTVLSVSCQEMSPGSDFLKRLASGDETPGAVDYRTWYSPCDGVINPFTSTPLQGAVNTLVPCETHLGFLTDVGLLAQVASAFKA
ncbi:alpha/beta fold hydrolase [Streptomyces roseoverticillatus]|uniref:esterase/lipase family protein n=1 Tax=Streptomyces roseoverticillatus TaxID=66429 RepID=UPI001F16A489|nr:alpha/beta fold hydrolase [Streptomyces roseoverticillatus]MCF3101284.1 alpha/beta fold hydrolase [Streptomyces roseoverticillatus]